MSGHSRGRDARTDADGVRVVATGARRDVWLVVVLGVVVVALVIGVRASRRSAVPAEVAATLPADPQAAPPAPSRAPPSPAGGSPADSARAGNPPPPGYTAETWREERRAARADARAAAKEPPLTVTEENTGLALFPAPGTKPVRRGIVVPEDFPLPDGYVRHYQTTDDGEMLPPILMFAPDYVPRDANGNPLPMPPDRVVPPELAPPGLPTKQLDVPERKPDGVP
jgi:hypothetical protein